MKLKLVALLFAFMTFCTASAGEYAGYVVIEAGRPNAEVVFVSDAVAVTMDGALLASWAIGTGEVLWKQSVEGLVGDKAQVTCKVYGVELGKYLIARCSSDERLEFKLVSVADGMFFGDALKIDKTETGGFVFIAEQFDSKNVVFVYRDVLIIADLYNGRVAKLQTKAGFFGYAIKMSKVWATYSDCIQAVWDLNVWQQSSEIVRLPEEVRNLFRKAEYKLAVNCGDGWAVLVQIDKGRNGLALATKWQIFMIRNESLVCSYTRSVHKKMFNSGDALILLTNEGDATRVERLTMNGPSIERWSFAELDRAGCYVALDDLYYFVSSESVIMSELGADKYERVVHSGQFHCSRYYAKDVGVGSIAVMKKESSAWADKWIEGLHLR